MQKHDKIFVSYIWNNYKQRDDQQQDDPVILPGIAFSKLYNNTESFKLILLIIFLREAISHSKNSH